MNKQVLDSSLGAFCFFRKWLVAPGSDLESQLGLICGLWPGGRDHGQKRLRASAQRPKNGDDVSGRE